jgi:myo-inositol-hexaphosphate 3-phosphohydrolase
MTLAGDIPMNSRVQLMMASVDDIADEHALRESLPWKVEKNPRSSNRGKLVGRKLVMNQRVEEEVEQVRVHWRENTYGRVLLLWRNSAC